MTLMDDIKVTIFNINKTRQRVATSHFAKATSDVKMSQKLAPPSYARNVKFGIKVSAKMKNPPAQGRPHPVF